MGAFVRLGRPLFLVGGFVLYALGVAVAALHGKVIDRTSYLLGQLVVTSFQLMTHYANDHFDYDADCANETFTRWSGGSRVLPGQLLPRHVALVAALVLAAVGLLAGLVLWWSSKSGPVIPVLVVLLGVLSWAYSAPPLRLHSRGLGELDVALVVTLLVPVFGFFVQAPDGIGLSILLLALVPLFLLQFAMVLAVEFPDALADGQVGKRTLVVRLGIERAAPLYASVVALAYLALPILVWAGLPAGVALFAAAPAPLAFWRILRAWRGDCGLRERWESVTFWAVAMLVATSAAELAAFAARLPVTIRPAA